MLTQDFADFSQEEYAQRLARLRTLMAANQMDAVLLTTDTNHRYFTGHHTHRWMHKFTPLFALLPLKGDAVLIVPPSESIACEWDSWVETIRIYPPVPDRAGVEVIVEIIKELGLESGRIGTELGGVLWMRMPFEDFGQIQKDLPRAEFVDASSLFWKLRFCKSPAEVDYIRKAVAITNETYQVLFSELKPGMTEREIYSLLAVQQMMRGAEQPGSITFAPHRPEERRNCDRVLRRHTDRALAEGDLVALDCGCVYRGYWSDYTRTFAITRASTQARDAYRAIYECLQEAIAGMKPGVPISDLVQTVIKKLKALGYAEQAERVRRIGHATGLDIIEPPFMDLDETRPLEEGMVFTVEPSMYTDEGFFMLEEDVLVTDRGYEILSTPASRDLPIF